MTDAKKQQLMGSWVGELSVANISLAIVFRFENDASGNFVAFLDSPDQGANGVPVGDFQLGDDGVLKLTVPAIRGEYTGTLSGDSIAGTFTQGQSLPLNLRKGAYQPKSTALALSEESFAKLRGVWRGQLGPLRLVITFEPNADGKPSAHLESPDQNNAKIPVSEVTLTDDALVVRAPSIGGEYKATLADGTLTGEWSQPGMPMPAELVMTKD